MSILSMFAALHVAAECGHVELADLLVSHGAVVNASDYQHGLTPLHLAAQSGRQAIIVCRVDSCVTLTITGM